MRSLLLTFLCAGAVGCTCSNTFTVGGTDAGSDAGVTGGGGGHSGGGTGHTGGGTAQQGLQVTPSAPQTITVQLGAQTPTLSYAASVNGSPANVTWSVTPGNLGTVTQGPGPTTVFTPSGTAGGTVTLRAALNSDVVDRTIIVQLQSTQNGPGASDPGQVPGGVGDLTSGGGVGGVGGEGLGVEVTDGATVTLLQSGQSGGALQLLYPYDGTVFPRRLLAPNLMWSTAAGDADAIGIELSTTSGAFQWSGMFGRPAILSQTGGAFTRHPIPQSVWRAATDTAGGSDKLTMRLTVARGGQLYGPVTQTWTIAPARLTGTIYYNSYGTNLAKNLGGAVGGDGTFGGAVLSIRAGDPGPRLVAGDNGAEAQCRVCHSVAASGSRLVTQHGENYGASSAYDLTPAGATETAMPNGETFPAMYPDGTQLLGPDAKLYPLPNNTTETPTTGLTDVATSLGTPAFSPDGTKVVFNPMNGALANPTQKLVVMNYDHATQAFSSAVTVADFTGEDAQHRPGWGAFMPDGKALVFHRQLVAGALDGNGGSDLRTRGGAHAQLAWTSASDASHVVTLNRLNGLDAQGTSYLPALAAPASLSCGDGAGHDVGALSADHADDATLNYEPTVAPLGQGGYAWVVFTSRRRYGNVAEIPPFCSDPRGVDLVTHITPKKLWVAAIDLNAPPGTDGSHPAFYLPGQELLAGNSRGFWVFDPCKSDGTSCDTGDECCGGYCPKGGTEFPVCTNTPPVSQCSATQEHCTVDTDCCSTGDVCINSFCTVLGPG